MSQDRSLSKQELQDLIALLERRLAVIADTELREINPEEQLRQLQAVSEEIEAFSDARQDRLPVRLRHFLGNSSLNKALDWAREALQTEGPG